MQNGDAERMLNRGTATPSSRSTLDCHISYAHPTHSPTPSDTVHPPHLHCSMLSLEFSALPLKTLLAAVAP